MGWEKSTEGKVLVLEHQVSFPLLLNFLGQSSWAGNSHQAICGLTESVSACTWAGEKPLVMSCLILLHGKGELLFEKGVFQQLSFFKANAVPVTELNGEPPRWNSSVNVNKFACQLLASHKGFSCPPLYHSWTELGKMASLRAGG